jgi:hypothetical protein
MASRIVVLSSATPMAVFAEQFSKIIMGLADEGYEVCFTPYKKDDPEAGGRWLVKYPKKNYKPGRNTTHLGWTEGGTLVAWYWGSGGGQNNDPERFVESVRRIANIQLRPGPPEYDAEWMNEYNAVLAKQQA